MTKRNRQHTTRPYSLACQNRSDAEHESCALALMNNGQHFIAKTFPKALIETGLDNLWQTSAYAGTTGTVTTALVKAFLASSN
jgi:hypothetical protein